MILYFSTVYARLDHSRSVHYLMVGNEPFDDTLLSCSKLNCDLRTIDLIVLFTYIEAGECGCIYLYMNINPN